ncbi:hypothetical protein KY285_031429 [Solanum tuberosum]|nr:hypothetical protein KY284_031217 [Solanum tuberosum]KAH0656547.1 hypothetical protein KY285_031429 [Solanum tuberosum]
MLAKKCLPKLGPKAYALIFTRQSRPWLVNALLEWEFCNSLVDEADNEGNTPLHLLAAYWNHVPQFILDHPSAKKMAFNKQNQTPLDIALSRTWTIKKYVK